MGVAGTLDACRSRVGGIRGTLHISSVYLTGGEAVSTVADQVVSEKGLFLMSSVTQRISVLAAKHVQYMRWSLCWTPPLCHDKNREDNNPGRVYAAVHCNQWCTARRRGYSIWTTLLCIVALLLLCRQFINRKEYPAPTGRSYSSVHNFTRADYGYLKYAAADALGPPSRIDSDLWPPTLPPGRSSGGRSLPPSPVGEEGRILEGYAGRNHTTSRGRSSSAPATRNNADVNSSQNVGVRSYTQEGLRNVPVSSYRQQQVVENESRRSTGSGSEMPNEHRESTTCARVVSAGGTVTLRCDRQADATTTQQGRHVFSKKESHEELASPRRPVDDTAQKMRIDRRQQRSKQHEGLVERKQVKAVGDVPRQRHTKASPDAHHDVLLQEDETPPSSTPVSRKKMQTGRDGPQQDGVGERRPQEEREGAARPVGGYLSRSLEGDDRGHRQADNYQEQRGSAEVNDLNESHESSTASLASSSLHTQPPSRSESTNGSPLPYFEDEKFSQAELKAAQNAFMADVTGHLSRLWRKHWLQAIETTHGQRYDARVEALQLMIEQLEVAVKSVILSRPRVVSMGLGRWLHKVREVFIFVFSTRLGLGVASADLRPVGPLAGTAHDVPEESTEVVEVVTGASQRVLLLAPASREENARCYASSPRNAWQRIQASLFSPNVEAQLVETRASLAKLFDLLSRNVASLVEDYSTSTSELTAALTDYSSSGDRSDGEEGSCRNELITTSLGTDVDDSRTGSIKHGMDNGSESTQAQHRTGAYGSSLNPDVGSDDEMDIPYNYSISSFLPSDSEQIWDMQLGSGLRFAGSPSSFLFEKSEQHAAANRRGSRSKSEEDLHRDVDIRPPRTPGTASTVVETERKTSSFPKAAPRSISATPDKKENSSVSDEMLRLKDEASAAQNSTKDADVKPRGGDVLPQSRIAKRVSKGAYEHNCVNSAVRNQSALADSTRRSSTHTGSGSIADTSKKSVVSSGVYERLPKAQVQVPLPYTDAPVGTHSAADTGGQMNVKQPSTPTAATSLEKQWNDDIAHAPQGLPNAASNDIRVDSSMDTVQSRRGDRKVSARRTAEAAEDAFKSEHKGGNGTVVHRKRRSSGGGGGGASVATLHKRNDVALKKRPCNGNQPSHLASNKAKYADSHVNSNNKSRSGGDRAADASTEDEADASYVTNDDTDDSESKTALSRSSSNSDGSKINVSATAVATLSSSINSQNSSMKSSDDSGITDKGLDFFATSSRITASDATGSKGSSTDSTAADRVSGDNSSTNNVSRGAAMWAGRTDSATVHRRDDSEDQRISAPENNSNSSGSGHGITRPRSSDCDECKNRGNGQNRTATDVGAGTPQETDRSAGKTSTGERVATHRGHPATKDPADSPGSRGTGSSPNNTGTKSAGTKEDAQDGKGSICASSGRKCASSDMDIIQANSTGDLSTSRKESYQDFKSDIGVTEPGGSELAGGDVKNTDCNCTKTYSGVADGAGEDSRCRSGSGSAVNSIAPLARSDSSNAPADTYPRDLTLTGQITVSHKAVEEAQNHLEKEQQHHAYPPQMSTPALQAEQAHSIYDRGAVRAIQKGDNSHQPTKRHTEDASHVRAVYEELNQYSWPGNERIGTVSSETGQTQVRGISTKSVPERKPQQEPADWGRTSRQVLQLATVKKQDELKRPERETSARSLEKQEGSGLQGLRPQHGAGEVDRESLSDRDDAERRDSPDSPLKTVEQRSGSRRGDDAPVARQHPVARDDLHVTEGQTSATSSENMATEPAKDFAKERQQQQEQKPSPGHTGPHQSYEREVDRFLAPQEKTNLPISSPVSSGRQQLLEEQELHEQLREESSKEARPQQEPRSPPHSSPFQKKTSSGQKERARDKSTSLQKSRPQESVGGGRSPAGRHPQAASGHAGSTRETAAAAESSKPDFTMYMEPGGLAAFVSSPKGTTQVVPKEEGRETKRSSEEGATIGDSLSELLPGAGHTPTQQPMLQHKIMRRSSSSSATLNETDARGRLGIELKGGTAVSDTVTTGVDYAESPRGRRKGIKGNEEHREACKECADRSGQPALRENAPLVGRRKRGHTRQRHLENPLKRMKQPEHGRLDPFRMQRPGRRSLAVRNHELQRHANRKEKVEHARLRQKEPPRRGAEHQAFQKQPQQLQATTLHPVVVPRGVAGPQQFHLALPAPFQVSGTGGRERREHADTGLRRLRRRSFLQGQK